MTKTLATDKQVTFIANLIGDRRGNDTVEALRLNLNALYNKGELTKALASTTIDQLVKIEKTAKPAPVAPVLLDEGYYIWRKPGEDDAIYKGVKSKSGGHVYATRYDDATGKYVFENGATTQLQKALARGDADRMTLDDAKLIGKATGRCVICGAHLTNPESVDRGIGPICAGRL